jgi:hypothetical protein
MQLLQRVLGGCAVVLALAGRYSRGVTAAGQVVSLDSVNGEWLSGGTATDLEAGSDSITVDGDTFSLSYGTDGNNTLRFN